MKTETNRGVDPNLRDKYPPETYSGRACSNQALRHTRIKPHIQHIF